MGKYILKRVLQFIPVFLGVTLILFAMENIVPGDPIKLMAGEKKLDPVTETNLRATYHLIETDGDGNILYDEGGNTIETPLWKRYVLYVNGLLHGDLGTSYQRKGQAVTDILAAKYPYTIKLAVVAIILETVVGIGAGMVSAIKRYSFWDVLVTLVTSVLVAMPAFWLGMLLQLFFGVVLKDVTGGAFYLPISADFSPYSEFQSWVYYILPAITLAAVSTAYSARIMRSQLLEVMNQDYIRTARAKGVPELWVVLRHALKNAIMPVVTYLGPLIAGLLTGSFVVERLYAIPGIGRDFVTSISDRDYTMIMGITIFFGIFVIICNLIVDIAYAIIDPRVKITD